MGLDPKLLSLVSFQKLGSGRAEIRQANPRTDEGGKMAQILECTGSKDYFGDFKGRNMRIQSGRTAEKNASMWHSPVLWPSGEEAEASAPLKKTRDRAQQEGRRKRS